MMLLNRYKPCATALFLILLQGILYMSATAQVDLGINEFIGERLDEIRIIGNKTTSEEIILREMRTQPGKIISNDDLNADQLRIIGLDLFSRVQFKLKEIEGKRVLFVEVTEEWYIFPMPFWDISADVPHEITYGFRYLQRNFRGRNETFRSSLWGGEDRGFRFTHITPWVQGTPSLTRSIDLRQITRESKNLDIKDLGLESRETMAQVYLGKRWSLEFTSWVGTRFRIVQGEDPRQLASGGEIDRVQEAFIGAAWDGRDLRQLPRRGFYIDAWLNHGWLLNTANRFQRFAVDCRKYFPIGASALCSRISWNPGWGSIPPYDRVVIKESSPIRSSRLSDEGKSFLLASMEFRFDIFDLKYFTWHGAPVFKSHFRNLKYGLAAELFIDVGDAYSNGETIGVQSLQWGYGAGLLLRVPYADVIRIESSWNPDYSLADVHFSWKIGVSF